MKHTKLGKLLYILAAGVLILGIIVSIGHWMDEKTILDQNNAVRQQVIDYANMQIGTAKDAKKAGWAWLSPAYDTVSGGYDKLIADAHEYMRQDFFDALGRTLEAAVPFVIISVLLLAGGLVISGKIPLKKREN